MESYLRDTIAFSENIQYGDQICYPCYRFFNQMLKSDVCMLSSGDIVLELKVKKEKLEKVVQEFEYMTPEPRDIVEWCLYRTALHACDLVASDHSFLFPSIYELFMQYLAEHDVDLSGVCVSKSWLLTFLGNELGELVSSTCADDRSMGTGPKLTYIRYYLMSSMLTAAARLLLKLTF